jgi:hypothetical protein
MRFVRNPRVRVWVLFAVLSAVLIQPHAAISETEAALNHSTHLPLVGTSYPWSSPFSVESNTKVTTTLASRADELQVGSMRLHRLYWRDVQPTEYGGYDWSPMSDFEQELRELAAFGIQPIVIVHHSPRWATVEESSCSAIRQDKFIDFAAFMAAAVHRYKVPEFNVHHWELGNEPDVDPSLVPADTVFGCWGDDDDPYYGGRHYGEMLKVVSPAIRAADPSAKILIGGLLLDRPTDLVPSVGEPGLFFKGILEAGAAEHFDMVPYHAYSTYSGVDIDYDLDPRHLWTSMGGLTLGKARFLRQTMAEYGVHKPLLLNETALGCMSKYYQCTPPPQDFYKAQADHLVRSFVRARSENVGGLTWYTLNGPGWREGGLLDGSYGRRPAYVSYRHMIQRLTPSHYERAADYGPGIEAHSFAKAGSRIHIVWSRDKAVHTIRVPQDALIRVFDRDGNPIPPTPSGAMFKLSVGFSPVYLELRR